MSGELAELDQIREHLRAMVERARDRALEQDLVRLEDAAKHVGDSASGSWIGYHANVYYQEFGSPEPGDHFSSEWGLLHEFSSSSGGGWEEVRPDVVKEYILERAGRPGLSPHRRLAAEARSLFEEKREEVLSILETTAHRDDPFLARLRDAAQSIQVFSARQFLQSAAPSQVATRDATAAGQGVWTPPHYSILADAFSLRQPVKACEKLAEITKRAASHLRRLERQEVRDERIGTNVFIGHGRSTAWKSLKDFVHERLRLPWDEFNRVPVAGVTNISRLSEMLDAAAFAFLVMTAEDEQADGSLRARENVVHEAGLFQGRLGFTRAVLLVEEGCEEFSNIEGLGQIRFPPGNIEAAFEEVRRVLEREGLIE